MRTRCQRTFVAMLRTAGEVPVEEDADTLLGVRMDVTIHFRLLITRAKRQGTQAIANARQPERYFCTLSMIDAPVRVMHASWNTCF